MGPTVRDQVDPEEPEKAVAKGDLTEERVNESVTRVLELKGVDLCEGR